MPATRSGSIPPRSNPLSTPSPPTKKRNPSIDPVPISLSSSEEVSPRAPLKTMRQNKPQSRSRSKKPPFVPPVDEVIEISSDDEVGPTTSQPSIIADFRRQINKLREESIKHKRDFERASKELKEVKEENKQLQALRKSENGKISLDVERLSENIDCEICTCRMWSPYILPDCGHCFCQSCLHDWFSSIHAQFTAAHPENDLRHAQNMAQLAHLTRVIKENPHVLQHRHITDMIAQLVPTRANYTCPTCREPVRSRPSEAFALKALVRTIAAAAGESSPKKISPASRKGVAPVPVSGPWDGFFPPRTI